MGILTKCTPVPAASSFHCSMYMVSQFPRSFVLCGQVPQADAPKVLTSMINNKRLLFFIRTTPF